MSLAISWVLLACILSHFDRGEIQLVLAFPKGNLPRNGLAFRLFMFLIIVFIIFHFAESQEGHIFSKQLSWKVVIVLVSSAFVH